ncbi:MAG: recombination mediator RecR [Planctomycetes bacterium]|nr:recombination mediator RecR [Planctomycetota bacterium]
MADKRGVVARLIDSFADLPGIGRRTAERLAYHVLNMPKDEALGFADAIRAVKENLRPCRTCFNLAEGEQCTICADPRRDRTVLCVVEQVRDLLALEQAGSYRGLYHVLQGRIAPLEGKGADGLTLDALAARVAQGQFREVILGTTPNVEGDATALVVAQRLEGVSVELTRLARGLTVGASLEQANREMLVDAFAGRRKF